MPRPYFCLLAVACFFFPTQAAAQQVQDVPTEEVVVNFAAGRVVIAVVKDAILIGTIENHNRAANPSRLFPWQ